jgi:hypothetical protein
MPAGAGIVDGLSDPTVAFYVEAERYIMQRVAQRLAHGLTRPSWAEEKLAEVRFLQAELAKYLNGLDADVSDVARQAIGQAYRLGRAEAINDLAAGGVAGMAATNTYTVGVLLADTVRRLESTHLRVLRTADDAYRSVIAQTAAQVAAGTMTRREACQQALWKFADQGVTGFVDRSGRNWDLASYAEMATRTAVGHAAINGHLETLSANGHDLVIVSDVGGECELCRPWEGKTLSIRGDATGARASVDAARAEGLFHPGCRHSTGAYFEGITPSFGATADPEGHEDRAKLRYLERQVRGAKLRAATAVDDKAAAEAGARVRAYQAKIRAHVDDTGLLRQRHREQITSDARLRNAPKPATPAQHELPTWAKGGAIERARDAFKSEGFMPLTDANGKIREDAYARPGHVSDAWIRLSGGPAPKAEAQLDHLFGAGREIDGELDRRTGGYFSTYDNLARKQAQTLADYNKLDASYRKVIRKYMRAQDSGLVTEGLTAQVTAASRTKEAARQAAMAAAKAFEEHGATYPGEKVRQLLAELRPFGGAINVGGIGDLDGLLAAAGKWYPSDWIGQSNGWRDALRRIAGREAERTLGGRAWYRHGGTIFLNDSPTANIHEFGHRIEEVNKRLTGAEWAFWWRRRGDEEVRKLSDLVPGSGYGPSERAILDDFFSPYMGKTYGGQATDSYELFTMGIEALATGKYRLDPEYRQWLLAVLGLL